jgi:hypothetical protein
VKTACIPLDRNDGPVLKQQPYVPCSWSDKVYVLITNLCVSYLFLL